MTNLYNSGFAIKVKWHQKNEQERWRWRYQLDNGLKVKGHNPQKAHLHPLRDVCMQYENYPTNALRDIVWKPTYHSPSIKVNNGLKIEGKKYVKSKKS